MHNDDLKSLVTQMYENLMDLIDQEENTTKEQVISYIKDSISTLELIPQSDISSKKTVFINFYKELTDKSLSSYENTNERFEELTNMHQQTLNECQQVHIDLPSLTHKFNDIQEHMCDEVQKANKIISELSQEVRNLEKISNIDALTKIYNRRALISFLEKICTKENFNSNLHLLLIDIDDFKKVNDTYGHLAGDKILIYLSNILKKTLRDGDKIFRYGGEEFVIIINRVDRSTCHSIASRLLKLVEENNLIYQGHHINVTMSIGSTEYINGDTPESIISRADKALYKSKELGKNQINIEV